jgi:uracil-DNA glycosylase
MTDIMFVAEAWGEREETLKQALVGPSGRLLDQMMYQVGIRPKDVYKTNVFNFRPRGNKIETVCGPKAYGIEGYPPLTRQLYVRREFARELARLGDEILSVNPNLIVALGNTPCWALLGKTAITKLRGVAHMSTHTIEGYKVLPMYHPAAVLRQWSWYFVSIMDLSKALRESTTADIVRPQREIWIEPSLEDIHEFDRRYLSSASRISVDIETVGEVITCIGFAPSPHLGIVIPVVDRRKPGRIYWTDVHTWRKVYALIKGVLERPTHKIFQNGLYDIAFLRRAWGIRVRGVEHDTMLLHHALFPESLKSLGFLGSVYTNEGAWKQMRGQHTTIKRED